MKHDEIWRDLKDVGKNLSSDLVYQLEKEKA
jgi:hypothetical protein